MWITNNLSVVALLMGIYFIFIPPPIVNSARAEMSLTTCKLVGYLNLLFCELPTEVTL